MLHTARPSIFMSEDLSIVSVLLCIFSTAKSKPSYPSGHPGSTDVSATVPGSAHDAAATTAAASTDGADGSNGADGTDGADESNGTDGSNRTDESNGTDGADGTNGTDGADGSKRSSGSAVTDRKCRTGTYQYQFVMF